MAEKEVRRLADQTKRRAELVGRRTLKRPPKGKRTVDHLSPEIRQQLRDLSVIQHVPQANDFVHPFGQVGDNSNTQFATLALWVAGRHGLPVQAALANVGAHFRTTQIKDGGWGYMPEPGPQATMPGMRTNSLATMTCAGVLGLAVAHGVAGRAADPRKDRPLEAGLLALGSVIGDPVGPKGEVPQIGGNAFYFLWSLERVAVALDLERIGKKDWYGWGAEVLLTNQQVDGSWRGGYADSGADTCFARAVPASGQPGQRSDGPVQGSFWRPG